MKIKKSETITYKILCDNNGIEDNNKSLSDDSEIQLIEPISNIDNNKSLSDDSEIQLIEPISNIDIINEKPFKLPQYTIFEQINKVECFIQFENELVTSADIKEYYPGNHSEMEDIVQNMLYTIDYTTILYWLDKLFIKYLANVSIVCGILFVLSHLDYHKVEPLGPTIAMAGLAHKNDRIVEYALRTFENWNNKECLYLLNCIKTTTPWVRNDWERIVEYIKNNGEN